MTPIRYLHNPAGLNNQKWALFGLFVAGLGTGRPIVLPDFYVLDHRSGCGTSVPIGSVLDVEALQACARRYGITILDEPPGGEAGGWELFDLGATYAGRLNDEGRFVRETLSRDFFAAFRPHVLEQEAFRHLLRQVHAAGLDTVVQLRIERDWQDHVAALLGTALPDNGELYAPGADAILAKVAATLGPAAERVFVVWDEGDLPEPQMAIRARAQTLGITLFSKSDFLPAAALGRLDPLEASIMDFAVARQARVFVGLSRSTFSNLVTFEAGGTPLHYIYNNPGPLLARRWDHGTCADAASAGNPLIARERLVAGDEPVASTGLKLTVHLAGFGDLSNSDALCAGIAGDAARAIEGFMIQAVSPGAVALEYRAFSADGTASEWAPVGTFVGSRGLGATLAGFAVRPATGGFVTTTAGQFDGRAELVLAGPGEACMGGVLTAMQVVVEAVGSAG
jgi:hypothetical protein